MFSIYWFFKNEILILNLIHKIKYLLSINAHQFRMRFEFNSFWFHHPQKMISKWITAEKIRYVVPYHKRKSKFSALCKCKRRFSSLWPLSLSLYGELCSIIFRKGTFRRKRMKRKCPWPGWDLADEWWDWNVADIRIAFSLSKVNAMFAKGALIGGICSLFVAGWVAVGSQQAIASGSLSFQTKPMSVEGCSYLYPSNNSTLNDL